MPAAGTLSRCSSSVVPKAVPAAGTVGGVDHDDVDAGAALVRGAGEVERDERAGRTAADDRRPGDDPAPWNPAPRHTSLDD